MVHENNIKRQEFLFVYETKDCNPNGDPMDEDKVRVDPITKQAIVTDVRIKRTIRDYLIKKYENKENNDNIFVARRHNNEGKIFTKTDTLEEFGLNKKVKKMDLTKKFLDIRLFGITLAERGENEEDNISVPITGPVQIRISRSLNEVEQTLIKGTSVFPSASDKGQGTFTINILQKKHKPHKKI